ncbi:MAG: alpha/beta fold hydrolase [Caldilineaceae bacterium]
MSSPLNAYQTPEHQPFLWQGNQPAAALLVHGFPGTPAEMRPPAQVLHNAGWTVQGMLLPGFGAQFSEMNRYSQGDWVQAVREALVHLQQDYKTVVLVGNSVGAALALEVAAQQPPAGLILFAPFWRGANRLLDLAYPLVRHFMQQLYPFQKADFSDPKFRASIKRIMADADLDDPEVQATVRNLGLPVRLLGQVREAGRLSYRAAAHVQAPVLVLQGQQDIVALPALTRQLVQQLPKVAGYLEAPADHEFVYARTAAWPLVTALLQEFAQTLTAVTEAGAPL